MPNVQIGLGLDMLSMQVGLGLDMGGLTSGLGGIQEFEDYGLSWFVCSPYQSNVWGPGSPGGEGGGARDVGSQVMTHRSSVSKVVSLLMPKQTRGPGKRGVDTSVGCKVLTRRFSGSETDLDVRQRSKAGAACAFLTWYRATKVVCCTCFSCCIMQACGLVRTIRIAPAYVCWRVYTCMYMEPSVSRPV